MQQKINEIKNTWTKFSPFPSPLTRAYLHAPFGAGVYELINIKTKERIYVGEGGHVAARMTCLLPKPYGAGTRNNMLLREYILKNVNDIKYRTLACFDKRTAKEIQDEMIAKNKYLFN